MPKSAGMRLPQCRDRRGGDCRLFAITALRCGTFGSKSLASRPNLWLTVSGYPFKARRSPTFYRVYRGDAVTAEVSSSLKHVSQRLPHDQPHANGDHAPYGHGKLPSHGRRLYNVLLLLGDDKLRPDNVSPLIRGAQRLDDCLCLLA
jgi:hypothetical protein